ncbi:MAG: SCP2 sterol-binding domain-containing protein [Candidatus Binatia bacterium]
MVTARDILMQMQAHANPEVARRLDGVVIQFLLEGAGGGDYQFHVGSGQCEVVDGRHASPQMTLAMRSGDFVDMIMGRLNGQEAFSSGLLRLSGDMSVAMMMSELFTAPESPTPPAEGTERILELLETISTKLDALAHIPAIRDLLQDVTTALEDK